MIYSFKNDYNTIACKEVMDNLCKYSEEQNIGYGEDYHSNNAKALIKKALNYEDCDIHFLIGGTSTNMIVISHALRPYEAVIAVNSGHINVHETGAVEGSGHKIITVLGENGKIRAKDIEECMNEYGDYHMVMPKMVYISNSTEIGTIYTKKELMDIYSTCKKYNLYLFLDGARLGSALTCDINDITLNDLCMFTDIFYIGGTKNGGALGEALVIINDELKKSFKFMIKNKAGLLAKGFINGIIFETLFTDDLYFKNAINANTCAKYIKEELCKLGFKLYNDSHTNQLFVIMDNKLIDRIKEDYLFEIQSSNDKNSVIRLCTSYNTTIEVCKDFIKYLTKIINK